MRCGYIRIVYRWPYIIIWLVCNVLLVLNGDGTSCSSTKLLFIVDISMAIAHYVKYADVFIDMSDSQLSAIFSGQEEFVFAVVQQLVRC